VKIAALTLQKQDNSRRFGNVLMVETSIQAYKRTTVMKKTFLFIRYFHKKFNILKYSLLGSKLK